MRYQSVLARFVLATTLLLGHVWGQAFPGVLTGQNDNGRTGQNLYETILTPQNVNMATFGKVFTLPVDGQIYAQPLYVPNVVVPNQGMHNVLYVATENDSVYAFDADGLTTTPLWHTSFTDPQNGVTPVPAAGTAVYPIIGITSTPVIDPSSGTIYVLARTLERGTLVQRLHALDITTGAEKFGGPVQIQGSVKGANGTNIAFVSGGTQRVALLLLNGIIYIGWTTGSHGWVMGYDAQMLTQTAIFNTTPNGSLGGVWQSGGGLAADSNGYIYLATGDGLFDFNLGGPDEGDTVLKLNSSLQVLDYFTPMDQACRKANDMDLGSGGPMLVPSQPGPYPDLLVQIGKGGAPCDLFGTTNAAPVYVLNRDSLGGYSSAQDEDLQTIQGAAGGYWSSPAYWQGPNGTYVYLAGLGGKNKGDHLKMYSLTSGQLSTAPLAQTTANMQVGGTPSISANGSSNGILWLIARQEGLGLVPGNKAPILYAYDATNVASLLYSSAQAGTRDVPALEGKFVIPTIANGRVYVGTQTEVDVYGLFSENPPAPAVTLSPTSLTFNNQPVGSSSAIQSIMLTNTGSGSLALSSITAAGNFSLGSTATSCPYGGGAIYAGMNCTIDVIFTPAQSGATAGAITVTDSISPAQTANLSGTGSVTTSSLTLSRFDSAIPAPFTSIDVGDFNGDGKFDIVGSSSTNGTASILAGNGDGTLSVVSTTPTGNGPVAVVAADFNNDGKLDAAVANSADNTVAILLGNGDGTVAGNAPANLLSAGNAPLALAKGDWNADGKIDLAVANSSDGTVSLFLGNGDGTFTLQSVNTVGNAPVALAVGDFNGDTKLDLAVANSADGTLSILLGNGDGTFTLASTPPSGADPDSVVVGDWNGDGKLDLAALNGSAQTVTVLTGNGDGTFNLANTYATGTNPNGIAVLDYNSDGDLDLAFANSGDNTVGVALGTGNSAFQSSLTFPATNTPCALATGDFNGDGQPDIATADCGGSTVSVLLQVPQLTLSSTSVSFGNQAVSTTSAALEVTLTNSGSAPLSFTGLTPGGANPGDFTITQNCGSVFPAVLAPGSTCTATASFTPTAAGSRSASLSITSNAASGPNQINFSGTGAAPAVTLSTSTLNFGNEVVGTPSVVSSALLTNTGNAALAISSIVVSGDYSLTTTSTSCPYLGGNLNAGSSCTLDTVFTPSQTGTRAGTVTISDNASGPQMVNLNGTGLGSGVTVSATTIKFTPVLVLGTLSKPKTVTLSNSTTAAIAVTVTITGTNASDFSQTNNCSNVAAWGSCNITVNFKPSSTGTRSGTLSLSYNGPGSPQSVSLVGVGTAIGLSSSGLVFPAEPVGTTSSPLVMTVTNHSTTLTVTFKSTVISGTNAGDFAIVTGTNACGKTLAPGAVCTLNVTFTPSAKGTRNATVTLSDNAGGSTQMFTLNGTGD